MESNVRTGPQGHIYLPKKLRNNLGKNLKLLPSTTAAVICPENTPTSEVIRSLQVIITNLELQVNAGA